MAVLIIVETLLEKKYEWEISNKSVVRELRIFAWCFSMGKYIYIYIYTVSNKTPVQQITTFT